MVFGSDGGASPANHPGGASASEGRQLQTTDAPAFFGRAQTRTCTTRIVSMQDSNACSNAITATSTGGDARREAGDGSDNDTGKP